GEVAREDPRRQPEQEDAEGDREPAPVAAAPGGPWRRRARRPPVSRLRAGLLRPTRKLRNRRHRALDASAPVDAVGLLTVGHPAGYGSQGSRKSGEEARGLLPRSTKPNSSWPGGFICLALGHAPSALVGSRRLAAADDSRTTGAH